MRLQKLSLQKCMSVSDVMLSGFDFAADWRTWPCDVIAFQSCVCECVNAFFWRVCVSLSVFLCFCSVSVCGQAIHQSVDSTARRITFPLPAHIPPILPFYLTPHSVPPDAPSLSGFIPVTYSECHRSHYHNMFLPLNRDVTHLHRRRVPLQEWHFPLP